MTKNQIKPQYLTPKVSVVTFKIEGGYTMSGDKSTASEITMFQTVQRNNKNGQYLDAESSAWPTFE